jgi:hypothetical protein
LSGFQIDPLRSLIWMPGLSLTGVTIVHLPLAMAAV